MSSPYTIIPAFSIGAPYIAPRTHVQQAQVVQPNILSFTQSYVPTLSYIPSPIQSYVPPPIQSYVPLPNQNYISSSIQSYVPSSNQNYIPSPVQSYVPSSSQGYVPSSSNQGYVPPSSSQGYVPSPNQGYALPFNQGYAPSPNRGYVIYVPPPKVNVIKSNYTLGFAPVVNQMGYGPLTMNMQSREDLPILEDHIGVILGYLSFRESMPFWLATRRLYEFASNYYFRNMASPNIGPYTLTRLQYVASSLDLRALLNKEDKSGTLVAPMGYGKTITILHFIINYTNDMKVMIIVPPHIIKVWADVIEQLGLYNSNASISKILIYHTIRENHHRYGKSLSSVFDTHRIVLTTSIKAKKISHLADIKIIDEVHKDIDDEPTENVIGLTAEKNRFSKYESSIITGFIYHKVPDVRYQWKFIDKDAIVGKRRANAHISEFSTNARSYKLLILESLQQYNKPVLRIDDGTMGKEVKNWVTTELPGYRIFTLKTSNQTVHDFIAYPYRAILIVGTTSNEGLTILTDSLVVLKPDMMATSKLRQLVGRLLRPNNPNRIINVTYIVSDKIAFLKTLYARCYTFLKWDLQFEDSPADDFLLKCCSIINLLGCKPENVPLADGCVIFDNVSGETRKLEVLDWWTHHHSVDTILSTELIQLLYL